jgi:hypothetical protein
MGQWHVAFANERFDRLFEEQSRPASRFAGQWLKPQATAPGWVLACRIYTPWYAVTSRITERSKKIVWLAPPSQGKMREVRVLIASADTPCTNWPGAATAQTSLVGTFELGDKSRVWLVSREMPLAEPQLPPSIRPRFFKGVNADALTSDNLRAISWGGANNGPVDFFEAPIRVQRKDS